jgi:pyruvate/2-oxoglutarate dehydrogenase complex dihydrolipoamide dehydrogenase (E3) component
VLATRGFKAVVFERDSSAGGQLKLAAVPPKKEMINWCTEDLEAAALRHGAEIRYDSAASRSELERLDAFAVIVATGALPIVPDIPGAGLEHVCTVNDVLDGTVRLEGRRVAVIGAGMTGLETAEKLAEDGNRIMVVEMADEMGPGVYFQNLEDVLDRLGEYHPELITSHRLLEIRRDEITLEHVRTGGRAVRKVDNVVLAVGVRSDDRLAEELKSFPGRTLIVGDARCPGRIPNAVRDGFDTAWNL